MIRPRDGDPGRTPEIVIATMTDPREADQAREALAAAGVDARISTIATSRLGAAGERVDVRFGVTVAPTDARRAIEAIHARLTGEEQPRIELDLDEPIEVPPLPLRCPECGSDQVKTSSTILAAAAGVAILVTIGWATGHEDLFYLAAAIVALILVLGPNRRCLQCGHRWME